MVPLHKNILQTAFLFAKYFEVNKLSHVIQFTLVSEQCFGTINILLRPIYQTMVKIAINIKYKENKIVISENII